MSSRSQREIGRVLLTTVCIGATIAAVLVPGSSSLAASVSPTDTIETVDYAPLPTGFSAWSDVFAEQDRLDAVATQIMGSGDEPGFGGIYVSPVNHRVNVYWHGSVPRRVAVAIAGADRPVEVHQAPFTQQDLITQLRTLIAQPNVVRVAPRWNASGLDVTVDSASLRASGLQSLVTAPISLTVGAASVPAVGKQNDAAPFSGAGRIRVGDNGCSAGFGVMYQGTTHMITAAHCASGVGATFTNGAGSAFGSVVVSDKGRDYSLVNANSGGTMWTGVFNSTTQRSVNGGGFAFPGNFVCRSSSYSNAVCGLEVTETNAAGTVTPKLPELPYTIFPMSRAVDSFHKLVAAGQGDSGGSVYTQASPFVKARGIVSSTPGAVPGTPPNTIACTGVPTSQDRTCHWEMYFIDITSILSLNNAQLLIS